jgi:hypothetical protein
LEVLVPVSKLLIMHFLARHEGKMYTRRELCRYLSMNPGTLAARIQKIRKDWVYKEFFKTQVFIDEQGWKYVRHYARVGAWDELFRREPP